MPDTPVVAVGVPVSEANGGHNEGYELLSNPRGRAFPPGLIRAMEASVDAFPIRFWIVDNSGSMNSQGGQRLITSGTKTVAVRVTRWAELGDTVKVTGEVAAALGARVDFHLLNPTPAGQFFTLPGKQDAPIAPKPAIDLTGLAGIMGGSPGGGTPLTEAVRKIMADIAPAVPKLTAHGQQCAVIIATDGLPNDKHTFETALRELQQMPVFVVVRLCTDQDDVVEYWNALDAKLESPLEVLDDLKGEAGEIARVNPWLTYGPPLHWSREFGMKHKLFDLLDETRLLPSQAKELTECILGCDALPEPEVDVAEFSRAANDALRAVAPVFDPLSGKVKPWVDVRRIMSGARKGSSDGGGCVIA